jgi:hypothetical protein
LIIFCSSPETNGRPEDQFWTWRSCPDYTTRASNTQGLLAQDGVHISVAI